MTLPISTIAALLNVILSVTALPTNAIHKAPVATIQHVRDYSNDFKVQAPTAISQLVSRPQLPEPPNASNASDQSQPSDVQTVIEENRLLDLINRERTAVGEQPLTADSLLTDIARKHSQDMCDRSYFDHFAPAPGPRTPLDRYLAAVQSAPQGATLGENIYYRSTTEDPAQTANQAHDAFMHSPGHRANILQPIYTRAGVGIYRNPKTGEYWVTEMFLTASP